MHINKWLIIVLFSAALIGFADSAYLTAQHVRGVIPPCSLTSKCETVLTSKYATIGPVPVSALGLLYYGIIIVLLIAYVDSYAQRMLRLACWLISAGMLGTLYFIFVQAVLLHAWCLYCLTSALMTFIMFFIAVHMMRTNKPLGEMH